MIAVPFDDSSDKGGFLVPPDFIIGIVEKAGLPLPSMARYEEKRCEADARSWCWRWLFHHYTTNALASFIVWRWPRVPSIVRAADELGEIYSKCLQVRHAAAVPQWGRAIEILAEKGREKENE